MSSERVDWFRVLTDLDRAGYNLPAVAKELGIPYKTLHGIRSQHSDPNYENGIAIAELWAKVVRPLPRVARAPSVARSKL